IILTMMFEHLAAFFVDKSLKNSPRLLKINPIYGISQNKNVHLKVMKISRIRDVYDNIVKSNDVDHENSKRLEEAIEKVSSSNDKHGFEGEEKMNVIKKLPLKSESNQELSYISRFIMENIIDYLKFLGRFNIQFFQTIGPSINKYVNIILLFMHDESHLGNPHLRATLAEALETILPPKQHGNSRTLNSSFAETIFKEHSLIEHLLRVLLHVFVLIELTG
ncbi:unnamed protein product, partial [Rotaria sp. Silwood2]